LKILPLEGNNKIFRILNVLYTVQVRKLNSKASMLLAYIIMPQPCPHHKPKKRKGQERKETLNKKATDIVNVSKYKSFPVTKN
jgi:hypothetical protein